MSNVYLAADLHIGHKNCAIKYRPFKSLEEHDNLIIENWNKTVNKNDTVYLLGDLSLHSKDVSFMSKLLGRITVVGGNHENPSSARELLKYVNNFAALIDYKGFWLTHFPIHPMHLRGRRNIHGHLHDQKVVLADGTIDDRYRCVSLDQINFTPIEFNTFIKRFDA